MLRTIAFCILFSMVLPPFIACGKIPEPAVSDSTKEEQRENTGEDGDSDNSQTHTTPKLLISAGGKSLTAVFEDNASASAFADTLRRNDVTVTMHDYGSFEKVGDLGFSLPRNDEKITTTPGDVILYQGNQITIYYDANTWNFTRLAHVDGATKESMKSFLGDDKITVTFSLIEE